MRSRPENVEQGRRWEKEREVQERKSENMSGRERAGERRAGVDVEEERESWPYFPGGDPLS